MSILTTLKLAFRALWRNKVRSLLTMLGIVFGIGAVIAMVAGGQGAQAAVRQVFQNLGTNVIMVMNGSQASFGAAGGMGSKMSLTWEDLDGAPDGEVPTVRWVAPLMQHARPDRLRRAELEHASSTARPRSGSRSGTGRPRRAAIFDEDTGNSNAKIAVIGATVAEAAVSRAANAIGQSIRITGQPYEVIGVLDSKGAGPMGDSDDLVVIPIKTYQQKMEKGLAKYIKGQLLVSMISDDQSERTVADVTALLRQNHKLDASQDDDFRIRNPAEFAKAQLDSTNRIGWLLKIVAAVSLFVGGIGVMNIMLVSVIERTREIGIRMAVGARPVDVMTQFLVESLALAAVGGVLGLVVGYYGAKLMASYFGWQMFFPAATAVIAFAVAGGVGVVFGLYPAIRASRLDPITALRYET